ncbi:TonB-dependent receptor [Shewanella sp. Isolate13]|uniref:TonB-dependent receptor n=1 Tax=Shewanella sp. Isolate13 TaxID=2908531 RepID=UPI001EFCF6F2|nr:TonB-dependent receptor [Shewanella sp. Isolate13]MCG9730400.1 TonB-dependent receptor [Shewanella sp. Isolate13]
MIDIKTSSILKISGIRLPDFKTCFLASKLALLLSFAVPASAEITSEQNNLITEQSMERIEVRGIRASMTASINTKRFSDAVVDAVTAEDIGKFPDSDVGESLGRISGIAVNRQFGQGQQVAIRGASNQLTSTLLNGHTVASTGWFDQQTTDRSFNYSLLPPEMVGDIEVYKSSQADIAEGGVGGTVIINTRKPFDLDANSLFFSHKQDYGTISEEIDPEFSGLYSWKNTQESIGVLLAFADASTRYQRNAIESNIGWGEIVPTTFEQQRERSAVNAALQYRPTDSLELGLNIMRLDMQANNANTSLFLMFPDDKEAACEQWNDAGTCIFYRRDASDSSPGWGQTWIREASMDSNTLDLDFKYETDNYTLEGLVGNTKSDGGTNTTANYGFWLGQPSDFAGTYDATGEVISIDIANKVFGAEDFNGALAPEAWSLRKQPNSDEETYVKFDITVPVDIGAITAIKTGISWANHDVKQESFEGIVNPEVVAKNASHYYSGTVSSGGGFTLPKPILDAMLNDAKAAVTHFSSDGQVYKSGYGTINEENLALYLMASFSVDRIRGNVGLRYISTDVDSDYYQLNSDGTYADDLSRSSSSYSDLLPSFNIAYDVSEDVIIRASASKVISRPNYDDMFAASALSGYADGVPGNEVVDRGNIGLNPFKAAQADLGIEWYFAPEGLLSATYFIKDISSFITSEQLLDQSIGIIDPDSGEDSWTVSTKKNGSGGLIQGVELQLQNGFENGLGYAANYTYADSSAPADYYPDQVSVFSDSSRHTVNLVGYYEMDEFSARLAYNWRSEYMIRELPGYYGNRQHQAYGTVDFSSTYSITEHLAITFEIINLFEADSVQLGVAPDSAEVKPELKGDYPVFSAEGEARYKLGVGVRF